MFTLRVCALLVLCVTASSAQDEAGQSWENIRAVRMGERVRVDTAQSKQNGILESIDGDAITFRSDGNRVLTISRADVTRVYTRSRSHRVRNLLIGTGVGAAIGAVLYGTIGEIIRNETRDAPGLLLFPIGIGAAIGAAMPTGGWTKVYENKRRTPSKAGKR